MDEQTFFALAKGIMLTKADRARTWDAMSTHMQAMPVRLHDEACHTDIMDEKSLPFLRRHLHASDEEKRRTLAGLQAFMREHPIRKVMQTEQRFFFADVLHMFRPLQTVLAVFVILILGTGATAYASMSALPGDALYPVKIGFTEPVIGSLTVKNEAKAQWHADLVKRRIEEVETVATSGTLSADAGMQASQNLQEHINAFQQSISAIAQSNEPQLAAQISANLDGSLEAHQSILQTIASTNADDAVQISVIANDVQHASTVVVSLRKQSEQTIVAKNPQDVEHAAKAAVDASQKTVADVKSRIRLNSNVSSSAEAGSDEQTQISAAENALSQGQAKIQQQTYGDAFILSNDAAKMAQESSELLKARLRLSLPLITRTQHTNASASSSSSSAEPTKSWAQASEHTTVQTSGTVSTSDTPSAQGMVNAAMNSAAAVLSSISNEGLMPKTDGQ